jgi:hypothetical protein
MEPEGSLPYAQKSSTSLYPNPDEYSGRKDRRKETTRKDLREMGWDVMDWIDLAQDRD